MIIIFLRNDPTNVEKVKVKKWKGFHKKARGCTSAKSNSPETAKTVLTKQNIRDVMQLIDFLVQEKSKGLMCYMLTY